MTGIGTEKPKVCERSLQRFDAHAAEVQAEEIRAPGDERARGDGHQPGRNAAVLTPPNQLTRMIAKQTTPTIGVMNISKRGLHRDEGDRDAGQRAEQRGLRGDLADDRREEAAAPSARSSG